MERKEIIEKLQQSLDRMKGLQINTYQSDTQLMNRLNPAFGFRQGDNSANLSRTRGVMSVWMRAGADDLTVHTLPKGYGSDGRDLKTDDLTDAQLEAILAMNKELISREISARKRYIANPAIGELVPNIRQWAEKCAKAAGPQHSAFVTWGKRAIDKEKYYAVNIYEKNDQIASISLRQDRSGQITYNLRTPLGGDWLNDETLHVYNMFEQIRECFNDVTNQTLDVDDKPDRKKLMQDIRAANKEWTLHGYRYQIPVAGDGSQAEQSWRFLFRHNFKQEGDVGLTLTGLRLDSDKPTIVSLAKGVLKNPAATGHDAMLVLTGTGTNDALLKFLTDKGVVDEIPANVLDKADAPMSIDVSGMYEVYLRKLNQAHFDSPLSQIRVEQIPSKVEGAEPIYMFKARLADMVDCGTALDKNQYDWYRQIADRPEYAFIEKYLAEGLFSEQLQWLKDMQKRITDVQVLRTASTDYIRCKIDGVQQMRQPITHEQFASITKLPTSRLPVSPLPPPSLRTS